MTSGNAKKILKREKCLWREEAEGSLIKVFAPGMPAGVIEVRGGQVLKMSHYGLFYPATARGLENLIGDMGAGSAEDGLRAQHGAAMAEHFKREWPSP